MKNKNHFLMDLDSILALIRQDVPRDLDDQYLLTLGCDLAPNIFDARLTKTEWSNYYQKITNSSKFIVKHSYHHYYYYQDQIMIYDQTGRYKIYQRRFKADLTPDLNLGCSIKVFQRVNQTDRQFELINRKDFHGIEHIHKFNLDYLGVKIIFEATSQSDQFSAKTDLIDILNGHNKEIPDGISLSVKIIANVKAKLKLYALLRLMVN